MNYETDCRNNFFDSENLIRLLGFNRTSSTILKETRDKYCPTYSDVPSGRLSDSSTSEADIDVLDNEDEYDKTANAKQFILKKKTNLEQMISNSITERGDEIL